MFIAKELKEKNISEYLLYMWQIEDLLRAFELNLERLKESMLPHCRLNEEEKAEWTQWYNNLIEMMHREGVEKQGHLQINQNILLALTDLHLRLMHSSKYPYYSAAYYKALPFLVEFRGKSHGTDKMEIENAFDALYGVWMLRLQKREITQGTASAIKEIGTWMAHLSDYYKKDNTGELEL